MERPRLFQVVCWPESQSYMELDGFDSNSYLINDDMGVSEYGQQAYFVDSEWLKWASRCIGRRRSRED